MIKELPDQLKISNYEYTTKLSLTGWAWEALRRNKEYRNDYNLFLMEQATSQEEQNNNWDKVVVQYGSTKGNEETLNSWKERVLDTDEDCRALNLSGRFGLKWGLLQMHDPGRKYSTEVCFSSEKLPFSIDLYEQLHERIPSHVLGIGDSAETIVAPDIGVVLFDLTRSFESQIDDVRKIINDRSDKFKVSKKKTLKQNKQLWLRHIRVLDSLDLGVTMTGEEIVSFFGGEDLIYADASKSGNNFKRDAKKFSKKHLSILKGYYSE